MHRLLQILITFAWALWFGGLVMLFVSVQSLFQTFALRHDIAGEAAAAIFHQFNRIELALAALMLVLLFAWWAAGRSRLKIVLFALVAFAAVAAVYIAGTLTPHIDALRVQRQTHTTEFRHLHGLSMMVYLVQTLLLLVAGIILPWVRKPAAD